MQRLQFIYNQFGNSNQKNGKENLFKIAERLEHARKKHTSNEWHAMNEIECFNALKEECNEVFNALQFETQYRMQDELLDVIAVAVRMLNKEYIAK